MLLCQDMFCQKVQNIEKFPIRCKEEFYIETTRNKF